MNDDNHIIDPMTQDLGARNAYGLLERILPKQSQDLRKHFAKRAERVRRAAERQGLGYIILVKVEKVDLGAFMARAGQTDALMLIAQLAKYFHLEPEAIPGMLHQLEAPPEGGLHQPVEPPQR